MSAKARGIIAILALTLALVVTIASAPIDAAGSISGVARAFVQFANGLADTLGGLLGKGPAMLLVAVVGIGLALFAAQREAMPGESGPHQPGRETPEPEPEPQLSPDRLARVRHAAATSAAAPAAQQSASPLSERALAEYLMARFYDDPAPTREAMAASLAGLTGATLTDSIYERAVELIGEQRRRSTPHGQRIRPVALVRAARERGVDWSGSRTHLGGLPRLDGALWPRGCDQKPLPFVAQIDLAEIAAVCPESPLPHEGSLAFFINDGAVLYCPQGADQPAVPPEDLPPAWEENGHALPDQAGPLTQPLFPFWPLQPIGLDLPHGLPETSEDEDDLEAIRQAQKVALDRHVPVGERDAAEADPRWYAAQFFARELQAGIASCDRKITYNREWIGKVEAYRAKLEAAPERDDAKIAQTFVDAQRYSQAIPDIEQQTRDLAAFSGEFDKFVAGRDPWTVMRDDEAQVLKDAIAEAVKIAASLLSVNYQHSLKPLIALTRRRMLTGDDAALAALPDPELRALNARRRDRNAGHQMFGLGDCQQSAIYDHMSDLLLLQIAYDDMAEMAFGDMGLWQFWISPADAAAGNWHKAKLTFECG